MGPQKAITKKPYFEGQIISSNEYSVLNENISIEDLKNTFGTKEVMSFKDGFFKKNYYNPEGGLIMTAIYDQENNKLYREYAGENVTYFSIPSENNFICSYEEIGTAEILNTACDKVKLNIKPKTGTLGYDDNMTIIYYLSNTFKLDPEWYNEYKESCYNEVISIYPGMSMGSDLSLSGYAIKTRAIGMTFMEIDKDIFRPDTSRKLVKQ